MNAREKAMLTYEALEKRKLKKKDQERQYKQDLANVGWNGTQKFINRENKRYYSKKRTSV